MRFACNYNLEKRKLTLLTQTKNVKGEKQYLKSNSYYRKNKEIDFQQILKRTSFSRNVVWIFSFNDSSEVSNLSPHYLRNRLQKQLSRHQLPVLSEEVLRNIFKKISLPLCNKWIHCCESLAEEVKKEYSKVSSVILLDMMLACAEEESEDIAENYKSLGKHLCVEIGKPNLSRFNILYYLPFIRELISEAQSLLPEVFIDCSKYSGFKGFYHPDVLLGVMEKEIDKEDRRMEYDWFGKLFLRISEKDFFLHWNEGKISKFINLIIQITKTIALDRIYDTLSALLNFFTDPKTTPKIAVRVYYSFDGSIVILPTTVDIYSAYCHVIKRVYEMGNNFIHFEMFHLKMGRRGNITLEKYDNIRENYQGKIRDFVTQIYQQLVEYYSDLSDRFKELLDDKRTSYSRLSSMNMEELIAMADYYIAVKRGVNELELNSYFTHFKVNNKSLIKTLLFITECRTQQIMNEVLKFHVEYCGRNCEEFYKISLQAVKVPEATEELISLSKFMSFVSSELMGTMRENIVGYLELFYRVMEIVTVPQTYLEMMGLVLGWVYKMDTVIAENKSLLSATKFEFEERLNQVTEKLNEDLENFSADELDGLDHLEDYTRIGVYTLHIMKCLRKIQYFDETAKWINKEETLFEMTLSTYPELDEIKAFVNPFAKLIFQLYQWNMIYQNLMEGSLENLSVERVEQILEENNHLINELQKWFKAKIRQQTNENNPRRFKGLVDDSEYDNWPAPLKLIHGAQQHLKEIKQCKTLISILCNPRITPKHWEDISRITGRDMTPYKGTSLRQFINFKVDEKMEELGAISNSAIKEYHLKENLTNMKMEWKSISFLLVESNITQVVLGPVDHIQSLIDDHLVKILRLRSSAYVGPIEDELKKWYEQLSIINITIEDWCCLQRKWMYFIPIFSSGDINQLMPLEAAMFSEIDEKYRSLLQKIKDDAAVLSIASDPNILPTLKYCLSKIDDINLGVRKYLDKKRIFFSRFFFLSERGMLMLLSETKEPRKLEKYLGKCFSGIAKLGFDNVLNINAIHSYDEEMIPLMCKIDPYAPGLSVEELFAQVEDQMVLSVRSAVIKCMQDYKKRSLEDFLNEWPGQITLCVYQYYWTQGTHHCFSSKEREPMEEFRKTLLDLIQEGISHIRMNKIPHKRRTLASFIIVCTHWKDLVNKLLEKDVDSDSDFLWVSQLRFYWHGEITIRSLNATLQYGYEYLGSSRRLAITALTERCYNSLINAFYLQYCGAPEGPSGSGKMATIKDLAQVIAVQLRIFNCSPSLRVSDLAKLFKGIVSSGSWACFHAFDRINLEVLSVVGQFILSILQAKRNNLAVFTFEGSTLTINASCFICVTLNPNMTGRNPLPSNLKVLFRPVAMIIPDIKLIIQTILCSNAFDNYQSLSTKVAAAFRLCAEQLHSQTHYDYGMRSIKAVLKFACNLKLRRPEMSEEIILVNAVRCNTLPKLTMEDIHLFNNILKDVFQNIDIVINPNDTLMEGVLEVCRKRNLQPVKNFVDKVIQTHEVMMTHHSVMLVGTTFGGKTTILKVLSEALSSSLSTGQNNGTTTKTQIINPIAVTIGNLFGYYHPKTDEWTDGIVGSTFRDYANDNTSDRKWIILDGPITPTWAENLNTALDENKCLFLNTGEVINVSDSMSIIFECMDLLQASPAILSRCGIVYADSNSLGWIFIVKSWTNTIPQNWIEDKPDRFLSLLEWLIPPCLNFIKKQCHKLLDAGELNSVRTVCQLIEMMLHETVINGQELKYINSWSQAIVMLSVFWGMAGLVDSSSREMFDTFYKKLWLGEISSGGDCKTYPEDLDISLPNEGLIEDNMYIFKGKGSWKYWPEVLKVMKLDDIYNAKTNMVTTVESLKYMFIMDLFVKYKKTVLLFGPTGTGKTCLIQNTLSHVDTNAYIPAFITFTVSSTAQFTQELIISKLVKREKSVYGPIIGKVCILFIDDLNMLESEEGTKSALELLRQYFDYGHWYDLRALEKLYIQDVFIIAAMDFKNLYSQPLCKRFLRHLALFGMSMFSEESLTKIFSTILFLGLKKNGFPTDIMGTVQQTVASTMYIYNSVLSILLPTPTKCHYLFNVRDLFRIFQGYLLIKKETVDGKKLFVRLWTHEILRVFSDRLVDCTEKEWLFDQILIAVVEHFKEAFEVMLDGLEDHPEKQVSLTSLSKLIFTTALDNEGTEFQKYEEVTSVDQFYSAASKILEEYNSENEKAINIILFRFALEHLSRICRIISVPSGNGLLVGVNGSGRQSLTKLAAKMLHQDIIQTNFAKKFCPVKWRSILKNVLKDSGANNKNCVFLLHETEVKTDYLLQDIDSVLNTGEVPMLYAANEIQDILEIVRSAAQGGNKNADISPSDAFSFYIERCKRNLHIMLCFSPIGSELRNRIRMYPSLINCCTVDWFETSWTLDINGKQLETMGWPEDALERVAREYIGDLNVEEKIKEVVIDIAKYFHVSARNYSDTFHRLTSRITYVTSSSFVDLLKHYNILVKNKKDELEIAKEKYLGGLEKLEFAANQVEIMQKDLESLQPALQKAALETSEMLKVIETETFEVEKASERVRNDEEIANEQAVGAMELKTECENDLALAIPILEDAVAALNTLKPADITLVKSMKNPPETVKLVLAAVCVMKGIKPDRLPDPRNPGRKINDYWGPSKRLLGDMTFLQQLKDYDKDNIPPSIMKAVRSQYLTHKDFKPKVVAKASSAAEGLCKWVIALDKYDVVVKEVAPKKEKLKIAEKEYSETMAVLEEKRTLLKGLEDKLAELKENLREANDRKIRLQDEVVLCSNKLYKAQRIIGSLGGEKERWIFISDGLQKQYNSIPGDILVSCGTIVYLASFTPNFRKEIVEDWTSFCSEVGIPLSEDYTLANALGSKVLIETWNINGLPSDAFSIDNAIILHSSLKWPVLIDPQNQANRWLKNMEKENGLNVLKLSKDYINIIITCISNGIPLLLENTLEQLDHSLNPILGKEIFQQGNTCFIKFNDVIVEYHHNFRLYITTKLRNPHYLPEVFKKVTVINFVITEESLSDKLLSIAVSKERPETQQQRQNLIKESAKNKQDLNGVEESILKTLSSVKGNILEDENAVNILDSSKLVAEELKKKEDEGKVIRSNLENIWLKYRPIADHVAALYCTITNLATLDPMYKYSLEWFLRIFIQSIDTVTKSTSIDEFINNLEDTVNYNLYVNVTHTLFNRHRILYSFVLCQKLLFLKNRSLQDEFEFLLGKRNKAINLQNVNSETKIELLKKYWGNICYLENLSSFKGLVESINEKSEEWATFCAKYNPRCEEMPYPWNKNLHSFQKLILLYTIRPDQLASGMIYFIKEELGERFLEPPSFNLNVAYENSNRLTPLIFINAPESDSMETFLSFSRKKNKAEKVRIISLGENQESKAEKYIKETFIDGGWLCLQNCHLAPSWLLTFENIVDETDIESEITDYRIWMTTISSVNFPDSILETGVKIIIEGPTDLKKNLFERYHSEPVCDFKYYESCPGKERIFTRLLYGITFFHSVVRERGTFVCMGWNFPYEFNEVDYVTTVSQLQIFLSEYEYIPFEIITYLIGECNYGGKIQDEFDKKVLKAILERFTNRKIIFCEDYSLFESERSYCLPVRNDFKDFIQSIKKLPSITLPEVLGLNKNAGVIRNQYISNKLLNALCSIFGSNFQEERETSEYYVVNVVEDILIKMQESFGIEKLLNNSLKSDDYCFDSILDHEISAFNHLQDLIKITLLDLLNAIKGFTMLTPDLEEIYDCLLSSHVPIVWLKISYPSIKPLGSYITDLVKRIAYLKSWYESGKPKDIWISGLYFPHSFLNAIKLDFARKRKFSVTELGFDFEVLRVKRAENHTDEGVYIYGIHLNGARWDEDMYCLEEELPMMLYEQLPLLWIKPCFKCNINIMSKYHCPLYQTSERKGTITSSGLSTNYILSVLLNTSKTPSHWLIRGVALVCQLDL